MKHREDKLRELFASDRNNYSIADLHVLLIDVFKQRDSFKIAPASAEEMQIPKILAKPARGVGVEVVGESAVVTSDQFHQNFAQLTSGVLQGLNWKNVFVAGGAVLAGLQTGDMSAYKVHTGDMHASS